MLAQLDNRVPDQIYLPIGCGTNLAAYANRLAEYHQLGLIDKLSQLMGVQAQGADAVVQSFNERRDTVSALSSTETIARSAEYPSGGESIQSTLC